jgi:hypothetical protein
MMMLGEEKEEIRGLDDSKIREEKRGAIPSEYQGFYLWKAPLSKIGVGP